MNEQAPYCDNTPGYIAAHKMLEIRYDQVEARCREIGIDMHVQEVVDLCYGEGMEFHDSRLTCLLYKWGKAYFFFRGLEARPPTKGCNCYACG